MNGTHSYVGSLPCGCGCSIVCDWPEHSKDTAKDVADMISRGLHVQRLARDPAVKAFMAKCERYPHEDWQRRHEEAREARKAVVAQKVLR